MPSHLTFYLPDGEGIVVSEDALAVLSPKLYEEFSLPYINELSEEFGGIVIHSCGNFEHQLPVLQKVHNLKGLNFSVTETRFEAVWEAFRGKTCLICGCTSEYIVEEFHNAKEWISHVLKHKTMNKGLAMTIIPTVGDTHDYITSLDKGISMKQMADLKDLAFLGRDIRRMLEGRA